MSLYKRLWDWIGGRPWTFIWRDLYHTSPVTIQGLWFAIGVVIYANYGLRGVLAFWIIYLFGFLEGHFHWGTKYIPGQKGL